MKLFVRRQVPIAACIYIGQILIGFAVGWSAPIIPKLQDPAQTPFTEPTPLTEAQASWLASLIYVGGITGPFLAGYLLNVIGRKPCLMLGSLIAMPAYVMVVFTRNLATVYVLRVVQGFGLGIVSVCNYVYLGEIGSTNIRGILLTSMGIFMTLGTLIIFSVAPYVSYAATGYLGGAMNLSLILGLFFVPESPTFHVIKGNKNKAQEILKILGRDEDADVIKATNTAIKEREKDKGKWTDLFTIKCNRKALFIVLTLTSLQQLSGVVAVVFFATTIFELAGSSVRPDIATIIIGVTQLLASFIAPIFVERAGRRIFLMAILAIYFYFEMIDHPFISKTGWVPLVSLIIFFVSYDMGLGIIPGTLTGEVFTASRRSAGTTLSLTVAWLVGFAVSAAFGSMVTALGGHTTLGLFSASCSATGIFTALYVPETKGKDSRRD